MIITPLDLPGATAYVVPLIAYGESVDLVLNNLDPFDFGVVPYGVKKVLKKVLTNTGRIKTSFTVSLFFFVFCFFYFFSQFENLNNIFSQIFIFPLLNFLIFSFSKNKKLSSKCRGLIASPHHGELEPNQSIVITLTFLANKKEDQECMKSRGSLMTKVISKITGARLLLPLIISGSHAKRDQQIDVYGCGGESEMKFSTETLEFGCRCKTK